MSKSKSNLVVALIGVVFISATVQQIITDNDKQQRRNQHFILNEKRYKEYMAKLRKNK